MDRTPPNKGRVDYPVSFTLRMNGLQAAYIKRRGGAPAVRELIDEARSPARPDPSPPQPPRALTRRKPSGKTRKPRTV
jgi:hypothetical protein